MHNWTRKLVLAFLLIIYYRGGDCVRRAQLELTMPNLLCNGQLKINIPLEIGVSYRQFGILLLEDDRGNLMDTIIHDERCNGVLNINLTILQKWLNGTGKPPTWSSLIEVLRDIELNSLADDIENELYH